MFLTVGGPCDRHDTVVGIDGELVEPVGGIEDIRQPGFDLIVVGNVTDFHRLGGSDGFVCGGLSGGLTGRIGVGIAAGISRIGRGARSFRFRSGRFLGSSGQGHRQRDQAGKKDDFHE